MIERFFRKNRPNVASRKPVPTGKVVMPDTGKRGVQPIGTVKPYPPAPIPTVATKED